MIALAIDLDNYQHEWRQERPPPSCFLSSFSWLLRGFSFTHPVSPVSCACMAKAEKPMQLGGAHLSCSERPRRLAVGRCLYCEQEGHYIFKCPRRLKD